MDHLRWVVQRAFEDVVWNACLQDCVPYHEKSVGSKVWRGAVLVEPLERVTFVFYRTEHIMRYTIFTHEP